MPLGTEIPFPEHGNLPFGQRCPCCGLHTLQGMQTTGHRLKRIPACAQPVHGENGEMKQVCIPPMEATVAGVKESAHEVPRLSGVGSMVHYLPTISVH